MKPGDKDQIQYVPKALAELEEALSGIERICARAKNKGSDYILMAAEKDESELGKIIADIYSSFGKENAAAVSLAKHLGTVHNLSRQDESFKKHSCEYARNIQRAMATEDYCVIS